MSRELVALRVRRHDFDGWAVVLHEGRVFESRGDGIYTASAA